MLNQKHFSSDTLRLITLCLISALPCRQLEMTFMSQLSAAILTRVNTVGHQGKCWNPTLKPLGHSEENPAYGDVPL